MCVAAPGCTEEEPERRQPPHDAYPYLTQELGRRLKALMDAGTVIDPQGVPIECLKAENESLRARGADHEVMLEELPEFGPP